MLRLLAISAFTIGVVAVVPWIGSRSWAAPQPALTVDNSRGEPIQPISRSTELDANKVALGRRLFHDPRLSRDNTVSCASCHDLARGGADGRALAVGIGGLRGPRNSPTVFNSSLNFRQFWDGRAATLEEQIEGPIHAQREMASDWKEILDKLGRSPEDRARFQAIYPDGLQSKNVKDAIATFERSLTTPDSRFDQFLRGNHHALTPNEQRGYRLFKNYGCASCHQGVAVGGNLYQTFGVVSAYLEAQTAARKPNLRPGANPKAEGRDQLFKVPGLRNVALTAPYFHDGSAGSLDQAVRLMARHQLGRKLETREVSQIVAFLRTLTGRYQDHSL